VTRYPAIFVDDVLVAKPKDFGFYGKGEGSGDGRYTPLRSATSHEPFRADLSRTIALVLAGKKGTRPLRRASHPPRGGGGEARRAPSVTRHPSASCDSLAGAIA